MSTAKESVELKSVKKVNEDNEEEEVETYSDIVGNFGPFQRDYCLLYMAVYLVAATQNLGISLYAMTPNHRCSDSQFGNNFTALLEANITTKCQASDGSKCQSWTYDTSFYRSTIVTEFDLVCDRSWFVSWSKSIYQVGYLVSSILFGWISDRHGRKVAFRLSVVLEIVAGLSQALSVNIYHFWFSRLILGIAAFSRFLTGMVILLEWCGQNYRARVRMIIELGWSFGWLALTGLFYLIRHFRYMQLVVVVWELILLYPLMKYPESPRWLLTNGKFDEATEILTKAAIKNGKGSREDVIRKIEILKRKMAGEESQEESNKTIWDVWKVPKLLLYSIVQYYMWFSVAFISYGMTYNLGDIGGSIFVTFAGFALIDIKNNIFMYFIVDRFKRRTLFFMSIISKVAGLLVIPIADSDKWLIPRLILIFIKQLTSQGAFHLIYLMAAEIYPTSVRQVAVGACSVAARVGAIAAPFVHELTEAAGLTTTFILFTILGFSSRLVACILPETKDKAIPDTLEQATKEKKSEQNANKEKGLLSKVMKVFN